MMTLTPAYGRDYSSRAKLLTDWHAGKDFIINDYSNPYDGKPINKDQLPGGTSLMFRHGDNGRKVFSYTV